MMEDTNPTEPVEANVAGTDTTLGDDDFMIDMDRFYSDQHADGHQATPRRERRKGSPSW